MLYNMIILYGKRVIYYDSQLFRIFIKSKGTGRLIELKSSVRKNGGENKCLVFIVHFCTELYDFTKPVGYSLNGDIEYYEERLKTCTGRILEAAVGSGRVIIPLLEAGFKVDGIDYSPEMLESCRVRCKREKLTS